MISSWAEEEKADDNDEKSVHTLNSSNKIVYIRMTTNNLAFSYILLQEMISSNVMNLLALIYS